LPEIPRHTEAQGSITLDDWFTYITAHLIIRDKELACNIFKILETFIARWPWANHQYPDLKLLCSWDWRNNHYKVGHGALRPNH
jgi:hypothetical protein